MNRLDQFIPVLDPGDAASNHTLMVQQVLRDAGMMSDIYTEQTHPSLADRTKPYETHDGRSPVLYQFAIGSRMADWLMDRSLPLAVNHHNVTPAKFFEQWDPGLVHGTTWGQDQLRRLADRSDLAVAVSGYNAIECTKAGFRSVAVAPLLFDPATLGQPFDPARVAQLRDRASTAWVFVGRLVPNKAQHRLIAALKVHRQSADRDAVLWLVGGSSSENYERALRRYAKGLGLEGAVEFTGRVDDAERNARLRAADVLVCASEHEGFCVPLVEALSCSIPVVAADAGAVAETLGTGGLVIGDHSAVLLSTAVDMVMRRPELRAQLVASGTARLADFALERTRQQFLDVLRPWLARVS
ncbi:MAG: glycosyltransferase family 4 protein [Acidimicrobiia bacterium]